MTSRERVRLVLNHQVPDRIPHILGGCTSTSIMVQPYRALKAHLGLNVGGETFLSEAMQVVEIEEQVRKALNIDIVRVAEKEPTGASTHNRTADIITDEWGVEWRRPLGGLYYDANNAPLGEAAIEDLDAYPWPDADNPERTAGLEEKALQIYENSEYALYGDLPGDNIFEYAMYLGACKSSCWTW